ncbi:NADH-quinone oxidoreductase subunit B, partial [Bacillus thuringiensis]
MVINFEELHPNERAELERNIFFSTLEQLKGWARS